MLMFYIYRETFRFASWMIHHSMPAPITCCLRPAWSTFAKIDYRVGRAPKKDRLALLNIWIGIVFNLDRSAAIRSCFIRLRWSEIWRMVYPFSRSLSSWQMRERSEKTRQHGWIPTIYTICANLHRFSKRGWHCHGILVSPWRSHFFIVVQGETHGA